MNLRGNYKSRKKNSNKNSLKTSQEEKSLIEDEEHFVEIISKFCDAYDKKDELALDRTLNQLASYSSKIKISDYVSFRSTQIFSKVIELLQPDVPPFIRKAAILALKKFYRFYNPEISSQYVPQVIPVLLEYIHQNPTEESCVHVSLIQVICYTSPNVRDFVLNLFPLPDVLSLIQFQFEQDPESQLIKNLLELIQSYYNFPLDTQLILNSFDSIIQNLGFVWPDQVTSLIYFLVNTKDENSILTFQNYGFYFENILQHDGLIESKRNVISLLEIIFQQTQVCCIDGTILVPFIVHDDDHLSIESMIFISELIKFDNTLFETFRNYELLSNLKTKIQHGNFKCKKQAGYCLSFIANFASAEDFKQMLFIGLISSVINMFGLEDVELSRQLLALILRFLNSYVIETNPKEKAFFMSNLNDVNGLNVISEIAESDFDDECAQLANNILLELDQIEEEEIDVEPLNERNPIDVIMSEAFPEFG